MAHDFTVGSLGNGVAFEEIDSIGTQTMDLSYSPLDECDDLG